MKRVAAMFLLAWFVSCGVKQPTTQLDTAEFGSIIVRSFPPGGLIYLNDRNTTRFTPDTLDHISPGRHVVRVILEEYESTPDSIVVQVSANTQSTAEFTLKKLQRTGFVFIESAPQGGDILIDNQNTGKVTPDTLQLETGDHQLSIQKNGYVSESREIRIQPDSTLHLSLSLNIQRCILLEAFGNVSCAPCVDAAHNLHTFVESFPAEQYAIVEYFANWPSPNDPFYKQAPDDVMQRLLVYQFTALPSLMIGGTTGVDATQYAEIETAFQSLYATADPPIGLSISKTLLDGELSVHVETTCLSPCNDLQDYLLFVTVVENNIQFDSPPGSNGLTDFNFVFRGFLSSNTGDALDPSQPTHEFQYRLTWPSWDYEHSQIVAFIQHKETKHIIHTSIN